MSSQEIILFCGDTFLKTSDGADPFEQIMPSIRHGVICVNLETSLKGKSMVNKTVALAVDEGALKSLPQQVRYVSIVNNHAADSADPLELSKVLSNMGKCVIGPRNPSRLQDVLAGKTIEYFSAYLTLPRFRMSYNDGVVNDLIEMIKSSNAGLRIVNLHWGYEHTDVPAPFQITLAHQIVEAGANLIIGHHPHVAQGWEIYKNASIFYSLGNFNFWQPDSSTRENNRWGYMVSFELNGKRAIVIPYKINNNYQPCCVTEEEKEKLDGKAEYLNKKLKSVDTAEWFQKNYKNWYLHEIHAWKSDLLRERSLSVLIKCGVWFILPLQLCFYYYFIKKIFKQNDDICH